MEITNNVSPSAVSSILVVIVKRLCEDQHSSQIFQEDEKSRLKELLSLDESSIDLVIFILHHTIRHVCLNIKFINNKIK